MLRRLKGWIVDIYRKSDSTLDNALFEFFLIILAFYLERIINDKLGILPQDVPWGPLKQTLHIVAFFLLIIICVGIVFMVNQFRNCKWVAKEKSGYRILFWLLILVIPVCLYQSITYLSSITTKIAEIESTKTYSLTPNINFVVTVISKHYNHDTTALARIFLYYILFTTIIFKYNWSTIVRFWQRNIRWRNWIILLLGTWLLWSLFFLSVLYAWVFIHEFSHSIMCKAISGNPSIVRIFPSPAIKCEGIFNNQMLTCTSFQYFILMAIPYILGAIAAISLLILKNKFPIYLRYTFAFVLFTEIVVNYFGMLFVNTDFSNMRRVNLSYFWISMIISSIQIYCSYRILKEDLPNTWVFIGNKVSDLRRKVRGQE